MIRIEKTDGRCTGTGSFEGKELFIALPPASQNDEDLQLNADWNRAVKLLEAVLMLIEEGKLKAEAGSIYEKENEEPLDSGTELSGAILVNPASPLYGGNVLQLIPLYREEINFAKRMGWRRLRNMFKFLTPEELNSVSPDRYNIITDVDGRRNCF